MIINSPFSKCSMYIHLTSIPNYFFFPNHPAELEAPDPALDSLPLPIDNDPDRDTDNPLRRLATSSRRL